MDTSPMVFVRFNPDNRRPQSARVGWLVDSVTGCHIWTGSRNSGGYGKVNIKGHLYYVHRLRYERETGPIPPGMELDHFACENRACCNPAHLRPVTPRENSLRSASVASRNASATHCPQGHEYTPDNLRAFEAKRGYRSCLTCLRLKCRERTAKRKG